MTIRTLVVLSAAVLGTAFSSGCATVTRGTTEQITVQSDPSGASVRLSNGFTGITPATFTVPRKGDLMVTVSKDGYETSDVALPSQLAGAGTAGFLGNALIGGIIGGGVDMATGATLSHVPNPLKVSLVKKSEAAATPPLPASPPPAPAATETPANTSIPSA